MAVQEVSGSLLSVEQLESRMFNSEEERSVFFIPILSLVCIWLFGGLWVGFFWLVGWFWWCSFFLCFGVEVFVCLFSFNI